MIDSAFRILEAGIIILLIWWGLNYLAIKGREHRKELKEKADFIKRNCR